MVKFNFGLTGDDQDQGATPVPQAQQTTTGTFDPSITPQSAPEVNPFEALIQNPLPPVATPGIDDGIALSTEAKPETKAEEIQSFPEVKPIEVQNFKETEKEDPFVKEVPVFENKDEKAPLTEPTISENPFADFIHQEPKEVIQAPASTEVTNNPFADLIKDLPKIQESTPKTEVKPEVKPIPEIVPVQKAPEIVSNPKPETVTPTGDPASTLHLLMAEIKQFVVLHQNKIQSHKAEIERRKKLILEEEKLIKEKKSEFQGMIAELQSLVGHFGEAPEKGGQKK